MGSQSNHRQRLERAVRISGIILVLAACSPGGIGSEFASARCAPNAQSSKPCNVVQGYVENRAGDQVVGIVISGGGRLATSNQVVGDYGSVVGGLGNLASGQSSVGGGAYNQAEGYRTVIGGGSHNATSYFNSTVGGGSQNTALAVYATVAGGSRNRALGVDATVGGGTGNLADGQAATIAGGTSNFAFSFSTVGGGLHNSASGGYSAVSGGVGNEAAGHSASVTAGAGNQAVGIAAHVGGGLNNAVIGDYAVVSGGRGNTIGGVEKEGSYAVVAGGLDNRADGASASVPGGRENRADGDYSLAAGWGATVLDDHDGSFLFADASRLPFVSQAPNEFAVRATGGVRFVTAVDDTGAPVAGVLLPAGSGSWSVLSDRSAKNSLSPVDGREVLDLLAGLPIYSWSYAAQEPSIRHIGPLADDFHAAFGLGEDPRYISSVDADGVALAAIQTLSDDLVAEQAHIERLELENEALAARIGALEEAVAGSQGAPIGLGQLAIGIGLLLGGILVGLRFADLHAARRDTANDL